MTSVIAGLSSLEASRRLAADGPNQLPEPWRPSALETALGVAPTLQVPSGPATAVQVRRRDGTTTFRLTRDDLLSLVTGSMGLPSAIAAGTVEVEGKPADLTLLVSLLAPVDPDFAILTP
jgi:hypothetical protein